MMLHSALVKLLLLRAKGNVRRVYRAAKTPRGAALTGLGALVIVLWFGPLFFTGMRDEAIEGAAIRQWLPLVIAAICLLQLLTAAGHRVLSFSPPEINFLFPGPFQRREVLLYKLATGAGGAALTALIFAILLARRVELHGAALIGLFLVMVFVQLFATAFALLGLSTAARAYSRFRRVVLIFLGVIAAGIIIQAAVPQQPVDWEGFDERLYASPFYRYGLAPFHVFARLITAEHYLHAMGWTAAALGINGLLLALIIRLDADYLEASLEASKRVNERIDSFRRGISQDLAKSPTARLGLPRFPRCGGAGALLWRQSLAALRAPSARLLLIGVPGLAIALGVIFLRAGLDDGATGSAIAIPLLVYMALIFTMLLRFDFRSELDQMDRLKLLPLHPLAIATGELLAPAVIASLFQILFMAILALFAWPGAPIAVAFVAFVFPVNVLLFAVENLFFLLFPTRWMGAGFGDLHQMGQQIVLFAARASVIGVVALICAAAGAIAYFVTYNVVVTAAVAWIALAASAASLCPVVAWAFERFDPSLHTPA